MINGRSVVFLLARGSVTAVPLQRVCVPYDHSDSSHSSLGKRKFIAADPGLDEIRGATVQGPDPQYFCCFEAPRDQTLVSSQPTEDDIVWPDGKHDLYYIVGDNGPILSTQDRELAIIGGSSRKKIKLGHNSAPSRSAGFSEPDPVTHKGSPAARRPQDAEINATDVGFPCTTDRPSSSANDGSCRRSESTGRASRLGHPNVLLEGPAPTGHPTSVKEFSRKAQAPASSRGSRTAPPSIVIAPPHIGDIAAFLECNNFPPDLTARPSVSRAVPADRRGNSTKFAEADPFGTKYDGAQPLTDLTQARLGRTVQNDPGEITSRLSTMESKLISEYNELKKGLSRIEMLLGNIPHIGHSLQSSTNVASHTAIG